MIALALLSLPIFGVIGLGWVAARAHLATPAALDVLTLFSFRFALPALLFRFIAAQPLDRSFNPIFYGGYLASGSLIFAGVFGLSFILGRQTAAIASARAVTTAVSNLGFLAPPLVLAFFGARGTGPLAMAILSEVMVLPSLGAVIMGGSTSDNPRIGVLVLRGTVLNPIVVAIVLGAAFAATSKALPAPVDRFFSFLGSSAGPTALFAVGGTLAVQRIDRATALAAPGITGTKLVIYPALVWYVLGPLLHVESFWIQTGVLIASFPSAGSNYVLAHRYAADAERVSAAIVLSTAISAVTVPLVAWLMLRRIYF